MSVFYLTNNGRWALAVFLLLGVLESSAFADHEFIEQPIGWEVQYFEPVDIDGDGVWELALQVGADGDSVGAYSPLLGRWIDGPYYLPVSGNKWGCVDIDGDGGPEYVYADELVIRVYNPSIDIDDVLLILEAYPRGLQVWGENESGEPTVHFYHSWGVFECNPGEARYEWYDNWFYYYWYRYSLTAGEYIDRQNCAAGKGWISFTTETPPATYLNTLNYWREDHYNDLTFHWYSVGHGLTVLDNHAQGCFQTVLVAYGGLFFEMEDPYRQWGGFPDIKQVVTGGMKSDDVPELFWGENETEIGPGFLGGIVSPEQDTPDWLIEFPRYPYAGMAYHDWNGDETGELLLPLADRDAWQLRDPQTGSVIDSIMGMPPVDLRTAPIMEPDVLDLYYFQGSTFYILDRPGMPTDVFEDDDETAVPTAFTLQQNYPNPFNASTVIEFSIQRDGPVSLEVFNILGQRVATLIDNPLPSGTHQISWDGTDQSGNAVTSGVYFYRLTVGDHRLVKKMSLLK